jgi:hypothetical protein
MRRLANFVLGGVLLVTTVGVAWAQDPLDPLAPPPPPVIPALPSPAPASPVPIAKPPRSVAQQQVADLSDLLRDIVDARDNPYVRDDVAAALVSKSQAMVGAETEMVVFVRRVTRREVEVEVRHAGKVRYALMHATPPDFGNLGTVDYEYPWRSQSFHIFIEPVGIRIGSEIPLELARKLRHADLLLIRGKIRAFPVATSPAVFNPWAHVILSDWRVVEVYDENTGAVFER